MKVEEYEFLGKPDVSNEVADSPNFNWKRRASQNEFKRGICMIFATDEEIANIEDGKFIDWYKEHSKYYHFNNDWKKKFKGSEFLIPVVDKEIETRIRMETADFVTRLYTIKDGVCDIDLAIEEYNKKAKLIERKSKAEPESS